MSVSLQQETTAPAAPTRPHLDFLDGIRALAALWVVLSHTWEAQFGVAAHKGLTGLLTNWMPYAHLAVDVFIVLSGFCLTLPVARRGAIDGGARRFFFKRARRILPPFYACLVLSLPLVWLAHALGAPKTEAFTPSALAANFLLLQDVLPRFDTLNPPLWSVAVEWKIYFFFPLLVWVWRRGGPIPTLALSALGGYGLALGLHRASPGITLGHACPWYLFLFALGLCAAPFAFADRRGHWWGALVGVSALVLAGLLWRFPITGEGAAAFEAHFPVIDGVAGILTASILVALSRQLSRARPGFALSLLSWRPLVRVGTFAYSLYLMHAPLLLVLVALAAHLHSRGLVIAALVGVGIPLIVGLCYGFFLAFERPFLTSRPVAGKAAETGING